MKEVSLQKIYSALGSRGLRIAALKTAELFGIHNLLVRMDTNNLCNLDCRMCPEATARRSKGFKPWIMKLDDFKRVAREVFPYAHVLYLSCAGEAFMTQGFVGYVKVAASYKVPFISFATNGMLIDEEIVATCIEHRISQVAISANAARAETFEAISSGVSFARLLENLALIRDSKKAVGSKLPEVRLNYTISKPNWREVLDFVDLANEYDVGSVQFRPLTPFDNTRWSLKNQLDPEEERQVAGLLEEARRRSETYGIKLLGHGEFTGKGLRDKGSMVANCVYPWYYRYIDPRSMMKICPSRKPVGNLLEKSYVEIMRSEEVRSLKRDVLHRPETCRLICTPQVSSLAL